VCVGGFAADSGGAAVSWFGWRLSWLALLARLGFLALARLVRRRRVAWGLYALGAIIVPVLSGPLVAMPRFGLVVFPFYVEAGARATRIWQQILLIALSLALMALFTARFVTWRWIA